MPPGPSSGESGDVFPADTSTRAHVYTTYIHGWPRRSQTLRALTLTQDGTTASPLPSLAEQDEGPLVRIYTKTHTHTHT